MPEASQPRRAVVVGNILSAMTSPEANSEAFLTLLETDRLKLERIVSRGYAAPAGEWCDQDRDEWVLVLKGRAGLSFADEERTIELNPGDFLHLPAHTRHRVEWTDPHGETVWLALHYSADDDS